MKFEYETYIEEIKDRVDLTHEDVVRVAAERGWGPLPAILILIVHFKLGLKEAKGLMHQICERENLRPIYDAAVKRKYGR